MENRRNFLKKTALGATALAFLPSESEAARIKKQGVQLYTVRDEMEKDPIATLQKVAAIGYKEVELAGYSEGLFYGKKPAEFKKLLDNSGLKAPSGHVSTAMLNNSLDKAIEDCAAVGQKFMVCSFTTPNERKTLEDFKKLVALFTKSGEACKKAGIHLAYHNHDFEFEKVEGQMLFDYLLDNVPAELMSMEIDMFWTVKAGADPLAYFEKYPNRFPLWHVKDMDTTEKKEFTEVGNGSIDFKKIFAKASKAGMKHFFVEQDVCKRPSLESIKISFDYLKKMKY